MDPKWQIQEEHILKDPKWQFQEEYSLLGYVAQSCGRNIPMFQVNLLSLPRKPPLTTSRWTQYVLLKV
jgi:hypothetical protein